MPSYSRKILHSMGEDKEEIKSTQYQSIVGKLMYYMKKVVPETANDAVSQSVISQPDT